MIQPYNSHSMPHFSPSFKSMRSYLFLLLTFFACVGIASAQGDYTPVQPAYAKDTSALWSISEVTPYGPVFTNGNHYGDVKFKGVIYSFFSYNLNGTVPTSFTDPTEVQGSNVMEPFGKNANEFDINRVYLTAYSQQSATTAWRITTDVYRNSSDPATIAATQSFIVKDTSGKVHSVSVPGVNSGGTAGTAFYNGLAIRLKYAYMDWAPVTGLTFRFGMQQTPWISMVEDAWKYRGVELTASDMHGFTSSADLGFSAVYSFPGKYGDFGAYVFNGQGYQKPEFDRFKDVAFRLQVVPMPTDNVLKTLKLSLYDYIGTQDASSTDAATAVGKPYNTTGVLLAWNYDIWNFGAEWDTHTTGTNSALYPDSTNTASIISIFGEIRGPGDMSDWALFGRYDIWNPTNLNVGSVAYPTTTSATPTTSNTKANFLLAGISYKMSTGMYLALNYQGTTFANPVLTTYPAGSALTATDARIFVSTVLIF